jgi:putative ABC transport system substrate-binding protein
VMAPATGDPVANGLVASLARPGGNVTGLTDLAAVLHGKRLELLKEMVPGLARAAVLVDLATPEAAGDWASTLAAAGSLRVELVRVDVQSPADLEGALAAVIQAHPDGLLPFSSPLLFRSRARLVEFAAANRLPALYANRPAAELGGLMAYGASLPDLFRRAAYYVDRLLKGAKAAELPVEQPTKFELVINLRTAQALGLTVPPALLLDATEVIQ